MGEIAFSPIPPTQNYDGEKLSLGEKVLRSIACEYGVLEPKEGVSPHVDLDLENVFRGDAPRKEFGPGDHTPIRTRPGAVAAMEAGASLNHELYPRRETAPLDGGASQANQAPRH
jgi:hypothetical protein